MHRSCPSVCPSVSLCVSLSVCRQNAKKLFSQKLSNLELWCLLTTYRKLCKLNWAFQRTNYWIPTIQDGWDPLSWKSSWRHFFSAEGGPIWIKFRRLVQNDMSTAVMCGNGNRCRIPIWRTFGRIQWHVIPQPHVTLQGVRIPSGILKIVFRHILFFLFLMQFRLWRAAAFVSSPIHLLILDRSSSLYHWYTNYTKCYNLPITQW